MRSSLLSSSLLFSPPLLLLILLWGFLAEQQQVESWALPLRRPVFAEIETTQARRAEEATGARQQLASIRLGLGQW